MVVYNVIETVGPANRPTGLPDAQPGSAEWDQQYRAATDPNLSVDDRVAAAQSERDAAEAEFQAAVQEALQTKNAPTGFVVVSHPDPSISASAVRPLGDALFLCRHRSLDDLRAHGFVSAEFER